MKRAIGMVTAMAAALALSVNAFAMEVPTSTVVQNLNGSQQAVKTYTVSPETDPQELIEEPFTQEGYLYTYADMVKEENRSKDTLSHRETVSVETDRKDLSAILEKLTPTLDYEKDGYVGTLTLDHTTLHTEAAGYTSGSRAVTDTKIIGPLDRNDMSYIPTTTVKGGKTLSLSGVEWQILGTDLVGETLVPSAYQAVATYSGKASYSAATGYVTTVEYVGGITRNEVESVTYRLTYLGEPVPVTEAEEPHRILTDLQPYFPHILCGVTLTVAAVLGVCLLHSRRERYTFQDADDADMVELDESESGVKK